MERINKNRNFVPAKSNKMCLVQAFFQILSTKMLERRLQSSTASVRDESKPVLFTCEEV